MATLKQIREIFAPVLAEHPDLVLRRRWLFRPPLETAIVGMHIGRTSSANASDMSLSVLPLSRFSPPWVRGFDKDFEVERVIGTPPLGRWVPGDKDILPLIYQDMLAPSYQAHLVRNFNAKARPFLDQVRSFEDIVAWIKPFREMHFSSEPAEHIDSWISTMRGDFAAAANQLQAFFDRMGERYLRGPASEGRQIEENVYRVLRGGDRSAIAAFLHAIEKGTIARYSLERFWRRTPFPFERK